MASSKYHSRNGQLENTYGQTTANPAVSPVTSPAAARACGQWRARRYGTIRGPYTFSTHHTTVLNVELQITIKHNVPLIPRSPMHPRSRNPSPLGCRTTSRFITSWGRLITACMTFVYSPAHNLSPHTSKAKLFKKVALSS